MNNTNTQKFRYAQEAYEFRDALRLKGLYVILIDIAADLSGKAYEEATKEYRYEVTGREIVPGDGVTILHYSDRSAYTVISRTDKTLTLQRDKATLLNGMDSDAIDKLVCHPGGFCGHVEGIQRYSYEQDKSGDIIKVRLTKKGWKHKGERMVSGRSEHYDYNF